MIDTTGLERTSDNISQFHYAFLERLYDIWEIQCAVHEERDELKLTKLRKERARVVEKVKAALLPVVQIRYAYATAYEKSQEFKAAFDLKAKDDPCWWIDNFVWVYDPRLPPLGIQAMTPMVLWPKQRKLVVELEKCLSDGAGLLIEKSRGWGVTEICASLDVHHWIYMKGYKATWGSRKAELVDDKMRPDAIFPRMRRIIYHLPKSMRPAGFQKQDNEYDNFLKLFNPDNDNSIVGESGDGLGRGGRSSKFTIDEFAEVEHQQAADTAVSGNSNSRVYISTPQGQNYFYHLRQAGQMRRFTCWWYHDPSKSPTWNSRKDRKPEKSWWYEYQLLEFHPDVVASQIDIKYEGSTEGAFIKPEWVEAAVNFNLPAEGVSAAGYDIAAGGENKGVYTHRVGPVVFPQKPIETKNLVLSFWEAIEYGEKDEVSIFNYDLAGIGKSAHDLRENSDRKFKFPVNGILGQSPAAKEYIASEGRFEREKYKNRRAVLWQKVADRFERTYNHVNKIRFYSASEMISIPDDSGLRIQLSSVKRLHTDNGKIIAESKQDMRSRGVQSPDNADSLIYSFAEENDENILKSLNYTASSKHILSGKSDIAAEAGDTYVSIVVDGLSTSVVALKWNAMEGRARVFFELESNGNVDHIVARTRSACRHDLRPISKWIANKEAMPQTGSTAKTVYFEYYKQRACLMENYGFDLYSSIALVEKMLQLNDLQISDGCDELILQMATWKTRGGEPMQGLGLATALCQVIQSLVKSNRAYERRLTKEYDDLVYYDNDGNRCVVGKRRGEE